MIKPWLLLFRGLLTLLSGETLPDVEGVAWEHWAVPGLSEVEPWVTSFPDAKVLLNLVLLAAPVTPIEAGLGLACGETLFSWSDLPDVPLAVEFSLRTVGPALPFRTVLVVEGGFFLAGLLVLARLESVVPGLGLVAAVWFRLSDFMALVAATVLSAEGRGPLRPFRGLEVGGLSHGEEESEGHFPIFCCIKKEKECNWKCSEVFISVLLNFPFWLVNSKHLGSKCHINRVGTQGYFNFFVSRHLLYIFARGL